jgi:hypothetical protein
MRRKVMNFVLHHPRTQAAKRAYEQNHPILSKTRAPFLLMYSLYRNDLSFQEISKAIGVSAKYVGEAYPHFKPFCGDESLKERRKSVVQRKRDMRRARVEREVPAHMQVAAVTMRANAYGCTVRLMTRYSNKEAQWRPYVRRLQINQHPCVVYWGQKVHPSKGSQEYARFFLTRCSLEFADVVVLYAAPPGYPERFFIFPKAVLLENIFCRGEQRVFINIPLRPRKKGGGTRPRLNISKYEDAWILLRQNE